MSFQKMFFVAATIVAAVGLGICSAQAEIMIDPSTISASASSYGVPATGDLLKNAPIHAVDGSGLHEDGVNHDAAPRDGEAKWWATPANSIDGEYLTIDLGQDYAIDPNHSLTVWNYNYAISDTNIGLGNQRGIRIASFWYLADDGAETLLTELVQPTGTFTELTGVTTDAAAGVTFDMGTGSTTATVRNTVSFNEEVTARYLRIRVEGGQGVGNYNATLVGLSEVQVFAVPEPGALALFICGLAGLLAYAWRKRKQ